MPDGTPESAPEILPGVAASSSDRRHSGDEAAIAAADGTPRVAAGGRAPSLAHILAPKVQSAIVRATGPGALSYRSRWALVLTIGVLFWALVLLVLVRVLRVFREAPEIGTLLAGKVLGLVCISFFMILLLSNVITSLSTFFLARDLDLLVSAPVDWLTLYLGKLTESAAHSSWMVALMAVPIFGAYGWVYEGGATFALVAIAAFLPFVIIPAVVGGAVTNVLVNVFPARRTRDILSVVTVLAAAGLVLLFRLLRPEKLARPEGLRSLVDFIALLRTPTSPFLPSDWVQRATMSSLFGQPDALSLYLLWSTAAAAIVVGALIHRSLYATGFTKAQESSQRWVRGRALQHAVSLVLHPIGVVRRELVLKELRVFFRDTTQWSQLILLAVLVVVYVFNVRFLPLSGAGVSFLLTNAIPFLNLGLAGFVLASIAARFIFPAVSMEGRTLWLLKSSPIAMRSLLWSKYWTGTLPLLVLALAIVGVTDALLHVSAFIFVVSVFTITLITLAVAGMALGLGTVFPQYETENAAQIPTSFGGLVFMMLSVGLVTTVVILEARPVYMYLRSAAFGGPTEVGEMALGFGLATLLCVAATLVPLYVARQRLELAEL
ncbi:MAG TPA: hypothetical protein VEI06_00985 [Gemmatimonadaceae bacterium]|nr:hypothetical protein [Gemmatimonadaceae bacterium]